MTSFSTGRRTLSLPQLHALSGVVPLGCFFVLHIWTQARALSGATAYERLARKLEFPGLVVFEIAFIYAPLLFHAGYGIFLSVSREHRTGWTRSVKKPRGPLQRVTGIATLLFLGFHLVQLPLRRAAGALSRTDLFSTLVDDLSSTARFGVPISAMLYLLGLGAASYHLANGVRSVCTEFTLAVTPEASRLVSLACLLLGVAVFLVGANTVLYFATGSAWL